MKTERVDFLFFLNLKTTLRIQLLHSSLAVFKFNDLNFCKLIQRLKFNFHLMFSVMLSFSLLKIPHLTSIILEKSVRSFVPLVQKAMSKACDW